MCIRDRGNTGDRYVEIWNLVFMEFNRDTKGNITPLPNKCVDTGMGLERIQAIVEGLSDNYDSSIFYELNEFINSKIKLTGNSKYGAGNRALHTVQEVREVLLKERTLVASGGASMPDIASSAPAVQVSSPDASSKTMPPPPPVKKKPLAVIAAASGGSSTGSQSSSASNAGQTRVDGFSPIDLNNPELIVIKSIYNVVG